MHTKFSRRSLLQHGLLAGALVPIAGLPSFAHATALTALDVGDPTATALGFAADATKVAAASNPTYKAGQKCGTCSQF